jgi:hypothetical protein
VNVEISYAAFRPRKVPRNQPKRISATSSPRTRLRPALARPGRDDGRISSVFRGARLPSGAGWQWTIGAQLLRASVTPFDAFVADDFVKGYRVLGTVVED